MSATTSRSAGQSRRGQCFNTHAIAPANTLKRTWPATADGRLRANDATFVVLAAAISAASSPSVAELSSSSSVSSS